LLTRHPEVSKAELIRQLKPPPEFDHARFESYRPDENFESQSIALELCKEFVHGPKRDSSQRRRNFLEYISMAVLEWVKLTFSHPSGIHTRG